MKPYGRLALWWSIRLPWLALMSFGVKLIGGWMMVILFIVLGITSIYSALFTAEWMVELHHQERSSHDN